MKFVLLFFIGVVSSEWNKLMENEGLYEGDMVLSPEQKQALENPSPAYAATKDRQWPGKVIPYKLDPSIASQKKAVGAINAAIADYHKHTCLRFKERTDEKVYITIYRGNGCFSSVGYSKYGYRLSLARGCWHKGTVIHEMMHAAGFFHEQSRPDRNRYVEIQWQNIQKGKEKNFRKQSYSRINSFNSPYDFYSVMHYGRKAFGVDGKITIKTKDPKKQYSIGRRTGFSREDVKQINKMYKCQEITTKSPPTVKTTSKVTTNKPLTTSKPTKNKPTTANPSCQDNIKTKTCVDWLKYCKGSESVRRVCTKTCKIC